MTIFVERKHSVIWFLLGLLVASLVAGSQLGATQPDDELLGFKGPVDHPLPNFRRGRVIRDINGQEFTVKGFLGRGEFGAVYLVSFNGKNAALKIDRLYPEWGHKLAQSLGDMGDDSPLLNIYYSSFYEPFRLFGKQRRYHLLVTEIAQGDLLKVIEKGLEGASLAKRLKLAQEVATDISESIGELLRRDYVHLDLKPGNIFKARGRWILGDYGSMRPLDFMGSRIYITDLYSAPETIVFGKVGVAADWYSLGRVMLRLLVGPSWEYLRHEKIVSLIDRQTRDDFSARQVDAHESYLERMKQVLSRHRTKLAKIHPNLLAEWDEAVELTFDLLEMDPIDRLNKLAGSACDQPLKP